MQPFLLDNTLDAAGFDHNVRQLIIDFDQYECRVGDILTNKCYPAPYADLELQVYPNDWLRVTTVRDKWVTLRPIKPKILKLDTWNGVVHYIPNGEFDPDRRSERKAKHTIEFAINTAAFRWRVIRNNEVPHVWVRGAVQQHPSAAWYRQE